MTALENGAYIIRFVDHSTQEHSLEIVENDGDYSTLHWKVFHYLLSKNIIEEVEHRSTIQPDTDSYEYRIIILKPKVS